MTTVHGMKVEAAEVNNYGGCIGLFQPFMSPFVHPEEEPYLMHRPSLHKGVSMWTAEQVLVPSRHH